MCLAALLACQDIQSQKEMIETTDSGYRYSIHDDKPGETAKPGNYVLIHTIMSHQDSVLSDTRENPGRPTVVRIEEPAKRKGSSGPVQDLLEMLSAGDSARLYYPVDSFASKPKRLAAFKEVTYDIKVVQVMQSDTELQEYFAAQQAEEEARRSDYARQADEIGVMVSELYQSYRNNDRRFDWQTTESGLKYAVLEKSGTGVRAPVGEVVRVHYYGVLESDGTPFDNSYKRGGTLDFAVGRDAIIQGWHETFQILEKGDKALVIVPSELGYGKQGYPGLIPADADLIFYVHLVGIGELD